MKIRPAGHRVLVKLKEVSKEEKVTTGGIIIDTGRNHEAEQYATQEAYVIALGITAYKGFDEGLPWCAEGDLVRIAKYAGENIKNEKTGEIFRIINDEDVFAIVEEETDEVK